MALWAFSYQGSIGAAGYSLVSEVPTSSLREPTQAMATMTNGLFNSVWSFALPYMINPDQANLGGKIAFIYFALCILADIFIFFYYPETKVSKETMPRPTIVHLLTSNSHILGSFFRRD